MRIEVLFHPPTSPFLSLIGVLGPLRVVQPNGPDYPRGGPNPPSSVQLRRTMALLRELWQHPAPYGEISAKLLWNISFSSWNRGHSAAYAARLEGEWEGEE